MGQTNKRACEFCARPNGEPERLYLHSRCHVTGPMLVSLIDDVLIVSCYIPGCLREVARFKLASQEETD